VFTNVSNCDVAGSKKEHKEQEKELMRQRDEYMHKSSVLTKELGLLQDQKELLLEEGASHNSYILKENNKLQVKHGYNQVIQTVPPKLIICIK
jgi:hypothetical protein